MAGIPISSFLDWVVNTGPQFLSGDMNIINSVSRRSFLLGKFLRGKKASEILQGSDKIRETLYLSAIRTAEFFERGGDVSWSNPQKDVVVQLDFKFMLDHMSWDEWEYLGQTSGLTGGDLKTKYKDMAYSKQQRLWESNIDLIETSFFFPPNSAKTFAEMESGGLRPYSIPVFVNEQQGSNGRFDSNWTTIENANPATFPNWDNARGTYDAIDPGDINNEDDGLFNAFDAIALDIHYEQPGIKDRFYEDDDSQGNPTCIATSKLGSTQIMSLHRKSNDMLIQPQDGAYPLPRWNGLAIKDVSELDNAKLYDAVTTGNFVAENVLTGADTVKTGKPGARYYFLNTKYIKVVFHKAKYFKMEKVKEPERKVGVYVIPVQTWFNLVCTNRRVQGIVSPQ